MEVKTQGWRIHLEPTSAPENMRPVNGYHPLPKDVVAAFLSGRG